MAAFSYNMGSSCSTSFVIVRLRVRIPPGAGLFYLNIISVMHPQQAPQGCASLLPLIIMNGQYNRLGFYLKMLRYKHKHKMWPFLKLFLINLIITLHFNPMKLVAGHESSTSWISWCFRFWSFFIILEIFDLNFVAVTISDDLFSGCDCKIFIQLTNPATSQRCTTIRLNK